MLPTTNPFIITSKINDILVYLYKLYQTLNFSILTLKLDINVDFWVHVTSRKPNEIHLVKIIKM